MKPAVTDFMKSGGHLWRCEVCRRTDIVTGDDVMVRPADCRIQTFWPLARVQRSPVLMPGATPDEPDVPWIFADDALTCPAWHLRVSRASCSRLRGRKPCLDQDCSAAVLILCVLSGSCQAHAPRWPGRRRSHAILGAMISGDKDAVCEAFGRAAASAGQAAGAGFGILAALRGQDLPREGPAPASCRTGVQFFRPPT